MGCALGKRPAAHDDSDTAGDAKDPDTAGEDATTAEAHGVMVSPKEPFGWPTWLAAAAGDALTGWVPRRADSFQKLDKVAFCLLRQGMKLCGV